MKKIEEILLEQSPRKGTITKDGKWDLFIISQMLANILTNPDREQVLEDFEKLNDKLAIFPESFAEKISTDLLPILQAYEEEKNK